MEEAEFVQFKLRVPKDLMKVLEDAASKAERSTSAEMIVRLRDSFPMSLEEQVVRDKLKLLVKVKLEEELFEAATAVHEELLASADSRQSSAELGKALAGYQTRLAALPQIKSALVEEVTSWVQRLKDRQGPFGCQY